MEEESFMKIAAKIQDDRPFSPTPDDPPLRRSFRSSDPKTKPSGRSVPPGTPDPYRIAEYVIKELTYKGKLEI
jgi:hypothetical protein